MDYNTKIFILTLALTLTVTVVVTKRLIPMLTRKRLGQTILDVGPRWHKSKEGTPTMGGIAFVIATIISCVAIFILYGKNFEKREVFLILNVMFFSLLNCCVGVIDDIAKIRKKQNEGLTPKTKMLFQVLIAILFLFSISKTVGLNTELYIPFFDFRLELGAFYYLLCTFLICGVVNAVNLTDGIDGLASTIVLTVGAFFSFISFVLIEDKSLSFFGAVLLGSSIGFLIFNLHPAKIFMGDTGSLFFGGLVVGLSFVIDNPLLVLIYGFVFIVEALSDILQVVYFKITKGKRLFKMAPVHHHLEKCGLSEMKIVSLLGILNVAFCVIAFFGVS